MKSMALPSNFIVPPSKPITPPSKPVAPPSKPMVQELQSTASSMRKLVCGPLYAINLMAYLKNKIVLKMLYFLWQSPAYPF